MNKRAITLILLALTVLIQWPLWFGKGGWLRVWELEKEVANQRSVNEDMRLRNQKLRSEVSSLRDGLEAIEERARYELGMVGNDEIYVQIVSPKVMQNQTTESVSSAPPSNPAVGKVASPSTGVGKKP
jgi:cell division protein FtsB